jgi:hypothetical protein
MARRVGFGNREGDKPAAPPIEPQEPERTTRGWNPRFGPYPARVFYAGQKRPVIWVVIGFLCLWLFGWTLGIIFAITAFSAQVSGGGGGDMFLLFWLTIALAGWVFAVWVLFWLFRGIRSAGTKPGRGDGGSGA